jgi:hypothetical protein
MLPDMNTGAFPVVSSRQMALIPAKYPAGINEDSPSIHRGG